MRTTISLDDRVGKAARRRAREEGLSLSSFIARLLTEALVRSPKARRPSSFRLITVGGAARPGVDLDRPSQIIVDEDEERYSSRKR